jgi:hypothetical protein
MNSVTALHPHNLGNKSTNGLMSVKMVTPIASDMDLKSPSGRHGFWISGFPILRGHQKLSK